MNNSDYIVTSNVKNKNQCDGTIEYDPEIDNKFSLSSGNKDHLKVVTVSLRGGKKHRATIISILICMWDNGANGSKIKRRHTKTYKHKMRSNKM